MIVRGSILYHMYALSTVVDLSVRYMVVMTVADAVVSAVETATLMGKLNSNCLRVAAMTIVLGRGLVRELDGTGSRGIEVYLIRRG